MDFDKVRALSGLILIVTLACGPLDTHATNVIELPIASLREDDAEIDRHTILMSWDQAATPDPLLLQWKKSQVPVRGTALEPLLEAFEFALARVSITSHPTGILSIDTPSSGSLGTDDTSAGAAFAVGFLTVLNGDQLVKGITVIGKLEPTGRIGHVRNIREKIRRASRQGYRVLLVPRGQWHKPQVRLAGIRVEPHLVVRELDTIDEAYDIMTVNNSSTTQ